MKILLIGGPIDGQYAPNLIDDNGLPLAIVHIPLPLSDIPPLVGDASTPPDKEIGILTYKLERIFVNGKLLRYEYHYQGR
ncbi:hypothetical protein [Flyfo siphovirus Tbat2_3]|nr:hypothetical protein [Flyfo siphovirus Tbat2_3]